MNEITRIHIAKTAYDIEIAAKKQLEKYIKSLETYTQDVDVLADIEIRITELLGERGVVAGGVVSSADVTAVRAQLGEPYEFADGEGDIAVGSTPTHESSRRLYRSTDDAVLGGVLSGIAAYFNVNPLWTRLVFILLLFISFGFAFVAYILFWILTPAARTATEKLQLVGKDVTVASIKELNAEDEVARPNRVAPALQQVLSIGLGVLSLIGAIGVLIGTVWMVIAALTFNDKFMDVTNGFMGLGDGSVWLAWSLFWVVIFGLLLLATLFGLIAYAFFAKKLTKTMIISGVVIIVLGIASVATTVGIGATQSWRVANESRSLVRETKANLPKEFTNVTSAVVTVRSDKQADEHDGYFGYYAAVRYVVDEGPARYELSALPTTKLVINTEGDKATIDMVIPDNFRNSFVQPQLTVYGPALSSVTSNATDVSYAGLTQDSLAVIANQSSNLNASGSFKKVTVSGSGSVDLGSSSVRALTVTADQGLTVTAGTVRELTVTQPDVCPSGTYGNDTSVTVAGVTSKKMTYNGTEMVVKNHETSCAAVIIDNQEAYGMYDNRY
jgi:phage shock protein PspC (stress-responsive transcriptional regulator)